MFVVSKSSDFSDSASLKFRYDRHVQSRGIVKLVHSCTTVQRDLNLRLGLPAVLSALSVIWRNTNTECAHEFMTRLSLSGQYNSI